MIVDNLIKKHSELKALEQDIRRVIKEISDCFRSDRQLLICGNGGSAADSDHIATEFLKGFMSKRPIAEKEKKRLAELFGDKGRHIGDRLQIGFKAVPLPHFVGLNTAFGNDVSPELSFAQMVNAIGRENDILLCLSTSGNAENVCNAAMVALAKGMKVISLTGMNGGKLVKLSSISIIAPGAITPEVQEYHLPIYHAICMSVEKELVG